MLSVRLVVAGLMIVGMLAAGLALARRGSGQSVPQGDDRLFAAGHYKEAYEGYRRSAIDPKADPGRAAHGLARGVECLTKLGRTDEVDAFRDAVVDAHGRQPRVLRAAAESLIDGEHQGFIIAGAFHRGQHRGGGKFVGSFERDRAQALQLLVRGLDAARTDPDRAEAGRYPLTLARALLADRGQSDSWRLQTLTTLDTLPDYEENPYHFWGREQAGAPVQPDGTPVYYHVPEGFAKAKNDGERWRWALAQAAEADAGRLNETRSILASFLQGQFGTQTIAGSGIGGPVDGPPEADNPFALHTLADDETIARLAVGIRRFTLPDEFNFIKIYQSIADTPETGRGEEALGALASIFQDRRQFDRAAEFLKRSIVGYGDKDKLKAKQIDQILGAWGRFELSSVQPAGRGASIDFRFRNGRRVRFQARAVLYETLLKDVESYLASSPQPLDWQKANIADIGSRLIEEGGGRYLGNQVAAWELDLDPPPDHFDRRITVDTPLQQAGAYLLTARMDGGNTSRILVWVDDTAIVRKTLPGKAFYFIADARTGRPIPRADVHLFGWRQVQVGNGNQCRVETKSLTLRADDEGQLQVPIAELEGPNAAGAVSPYQWVVIARTAGGRLAYLGFSHVWAMPQQDPIYDQIKVYTITDRPVYRPGGPVKFKFWVAHARYDQPEASDFAGRPFAVEILNPRGEKPLAQTFKADAFGGFDGTFELPSDATLGVYTIQIPNMGGGTFRVEEYKKPEFEVSVEAPSKPIMLGEKATATIKANYYFGGPVAEAKVKYKVTRTTADARWYPWDPWDWLFGAGYWWFTPDRDWYPGWSRWGVSRPFAPWWTHPPGPPEVVAEGETPIRPDGTFPVEIDTAMAKALHPDQDHRYEISAEVTDQSRRTIVGSGTVLVARKPFAVYTWVDRGHYRAGDTIDAGLRALTLDRKPVAGKGTLKLLKISYDAEGKPSEAPVESWPIALDEDGRAHQKVKAAEPGQYRIAATVEDGQGHSIEGGYLLTVTGEGFDGSAFRYNDLEIIPDRKEYQPGDTVRLQINTNHVDSTVLLFVRPTNGVYLPPKLVRLRGKSTIEEIGIVARDMPNFFVEALTISGGKVHDEAREIAVPPASRVVDVAIEPSASTYKPGAKARVKLTLKGPDGKPFAGSTVLAVYDKAVEYISGGSNVPDIKAAFWQWKRHHQPATESSLERWLHGLLLPGEIPMQDIGAFGWIAQQGQMVGGDMMRLMMPARSRGMMGGMGGMVMARAAAPMEAAAPMAAAAEPADLGTKRKMISDGTSSTEAAPPVAPVVRTNFADTAFWAAAIATGPDGTAELDFKLPESLTTWKVKGWTMGPGTKVGQADAEVITTKDLLVRLQSPRFFVETDEVVLSANVHNKLKSKKSVQVILECEGSVLQPMEETSRTVDIDAGSEHRVDWRVKVAHEGQAVIRMKALTDEESDAAEMTFPAYVHGMLKTESFAGTIRPDRDSATVAFRVPADRKPEQSRLEVRYSPTLAGAIVDALPYLADYPYGCTEQTLNRFLPSVIAQKVLIDMGVDLEKIRTKHTNLNAQELGDARERAKRWQGYEHNPVFDRDEVTRRAGAGLQRLAEMQLSDGGWGWFSGYGEHSWAHTTALVVHGLQLARQNDLAVPEPMIRRGVAWLSNHQAEQVQLLENAGKGFKHFKQSADDLDAMVLMVLADAGSRDDRMLGYLDRDRTKLSVYGLTLYGLGLDRLGEKGKLATVLRNIGQYVVQDDENQTAYLKLPNRGYWWWWYGSETETHAFYLELLSRTEPRGELASRLVKYLLNNRRHGTYWDSTRDTAFIVEAMAHYIKASGEDRPDMTVTIAVDGRTRKEVTITPADLFAFDSGLILEGEALTTGEHTVTIGRRGRGPLYFNAYLTNFTKEDPIGPAGLEIKVDRKVYRLIRDDNSVDAQGAQGQAVGQKVERYRRELVSDDEVFKSGDLVEIELEIASKNDYEYLVFEDYKAAGFEPVEIRSGYNGNDLGAYVEFRDERVAFFARTLARGDHSVSYRLRAEVPGRFHALPARGLGMYAPELRANSAEIRLRVED